MATCVLGWQWQTDVVSWNCVLICIAIECCPDIICPLPWKSSNETLIDCSALCHQKKPWKQSHSQLHWLLGCLEPVTQPCHHILVRITISTCACTLNHWTSIDWQFWLKRNNDWFPKCCHGHPRVTICDLDFFEHLILQIDNQWLFCFRMMAGDQKKRQLPQGWS